MALLFTVTLISQPEKLMILPATLPGQFHIRENGMDIRRHSKRIEKLDDKFRDPSYLTIDSVDFPGTAGFCACIHAAFVSLPISTDS